MWYYEGGIRIEPDWNVKPYISLLIFIIEILE